MRLINISSLKPGEKLGTAIRLQDGKVLLPSQATITDSYLKRLSGFGINCVYVEDEIYEDVRTSPALKDETKTFALNTVANIYTAVAKGKIIDETEVKRAGKAITEDVYSVMDLPINLFNLYSISDLRYLHAVNVATVTAALAISHGCKREVIDDYVMAGLLHDIKLNSMKEDSNTDHAPAGGEFLKVNRGIGIRTYVAVMMHHENYDGSGSPKRIVGEAINEGARFVAVADMYDNLVFGHCCQKMDPHHAVEYMNMQSGKALDPDFIKYFNNNVAIYPTGATVVLSNGYRAIVTKQNEHMPTRPRVRLCMPQREDCIEYNLLTNRTVFIEQVEM